MIHFTALLLFITAHMADSQWYYGAFSTPSQLNCNRKEGTSFTLVTDNLYPWNYEYSVSNFLNHLSEKFPCVQRQYNLIRVNHSVISESVTEIKDEFISNIHNYDFWDYYYPFLQLSYNESIKSIFCNHSILHGIKRALEISPAESFILTLSSGCVIDQNNMEILAEINQLLNETKSQVFFINYDLCGSELQEDILHDIATQSFGHYSKMYIYSISEALYGLDLFLLKPLNSSLRILNVDLRPYSQYRGEFDVISSLSFLMVTTNGNGIFNFTDPDGNNPVFEKKRSHITGDTFLVKFPISGTWTLEMVCFGFCSVRIWGFTGLESLGNCSDSDCDPNASCEEFGGYQECTCSDGFQGDGLICHDINECDDYFLNKCNHYCTNTIGSFNCSCFPGFEYVEKKGCVDINECLNQVCHPFATCTNWYGSYTCTCLGGYYGDGKYCQVECQQETMCNTDTNCEVSLGPPGCFDPCSTYKVVDEQWRLFNSVFDYYSWYRSDYGMHGWYRFQGRTELKIPEHCLEEYSCGTQSPLWINGTHPKIEDGTMNATVCASLEGDCCTWTNPISIRACPSGYYVYNIQGTPMWYSAYCTEPLMENPNCSVYCAADEECRTLEGKSECHCRNNFDSVTASETNNLNPDLVCESNQITLSYSKCMLENMGYDTSSIYLKDRTCTGVIKRQYNSYVQIIMLPRSGYCGAELKVNKTHLTYSNSVYLSQKLDGTIQRNDAIVNFHCSYPLNMEVSLWTAINPFVSSVNLSIGGTGLYSAQMAMYKDTGFSMPFEGSDVWLSTDSVLYIGVIVEEIQEFSFSLLMKNCYATPTADSGHPLKYYIIKDNCPNRNDPSISVQQNGLSLHGQFSIQVFRFIGSYDQVYLHCQIKLCDTSTGSCIPKCTGMRSASLDNEKDTTLTLGPIRHRVLAPLPEPLPAPAPLTSGTGVTTSLIILILAMCFNHMT